MARYDDRQKAITGKFIGFIDNNRTTQFKDSSAPFGTRERLLFGVIYLNDDLTSVTQQTPCTYVKGDINLDVINKAQCLWIDANSRASNGKAYCW